MRTLFFGANWKMNFSSQQAHQFFKTFSELENYDNDVVFFPPIQLSIYLQNIFGRQFNIGAQNSYYPNNGAFTGETSVSMFAADNIRYFLVGHSERRSLFCESDELIHQKLKAIFDQGQTAVLCIGESQEIKNQGQYSQYIQNQLLNVLKGLNFKESQLIIAYEPIWAIGTGISATLDDIQEIHSLIRLVLEQLHLNANDIRIIYGGSVNTDNIQNILTLPDVDGALVGGASLDPHNFHAIAQQSRP